MDDGRTAGELGHVTHSTPMRLRRTQTVACVVVSVNSWARAGQPQRQVRDDDHLLRIDDQRPSGGPRAPVTAMNPVESAPAARAVGERPRHRTTRYGIRRHKTPCDRRHTGALTKMLTSWLAKTSVACQIRRSPAIPDGVSEGIRTLDTQDHNLVL